MSRRLHHFRKGVIILYTDGQGKVHSVVYKHEIRKDKYGQNVRLKCACGITTNWHCEEWKAKHAMYEEHSYVARRS